MRRDAAGMTVINQVLLTEPEGYALLKKAGIAVPAFEVVHSAAEAHAAAERLGVPVVMKVISPELVHKSDAGGVKTGIASPGEARTAYDEITQNVLSSRPSLSIAGIIVEQQMLPGLEMLIGGKTDPTFGKVITVGMGGTLVELISDVSVAVLPVSQPDVEKMIRALRGYRLLAGYRSTPPLDEAGLVRAVMSAAMHFFENTEITEFDINPLILYPDGICAVNARFYRDSGRIPAEVKALTPPPESRLFMPRSIAVIGASPDPAKVGYAICRNLLAFPGILYPVNPKHKEILGKPAYPSLEAIPGPVDVAVIAIPAAGVLDAVGAVGKKGTPLAVILSSGFRETGSSGKALEDALIAAAHQAGVRLMGPNCLGYMIPGGKINTTFDPISPKAGNIAFVSQSGAIVSTIVDWSIPEEIGFSTIFSVGNQADLTFEDFIHVAASHPDTKALILYIEEIRNGSRFIEEAGKVAAVKPVVAIKSGSSAVGRHAAASHTGSLAGSYAVYQAAFRKTGITPAGSIREAFQAAELLASEGYPHGPRAIIISNAGGFAVLGSDYAERYGITMAGFPDDLLGELNAVLPSSWSHANPIDMVGDSGPDRYARTFDIMIRHQDLWDIAFVITAPSAVSDPARIATEIVRFSHHTKKMIISCFIGGDSMKAAIHILRDAHIPNFPEPEDAFRVAGTICRSNVQKNQ
jgi:acetyl coenzyme A synthetase (ADP forming)-like protein